jgi:hypothetical protein
LVNCLGSRGSREDSTFLINESSTTSIASIAKSEEKKSEVNMAKTTLPQSARRDSVLAIDVSFDGLVSAIKKLKKKERENFLEDLLAATSPEYLESIREARRDYREGRVYAHDEVFRGVK